MVEIQEFQKDYVDLWTQKVALKIENGQFLKILNQKILQVIKNFLKASFGCKRM